MGRVPAMMYVLQEAVQHVLAGCRGGGWLVSRTAMMPTTVVLPDVVIA